MWVLLAVASAAFGRQTHRIDIVEVAAFAFGRLVAASERKFRVAIMVEADRLPTLRCMAAFAARSVGAFVHILQPVTA